MIKLKSRHEILLNRNIIIFKTDVLYLLKSVFKTKFWIDSFFNNYAIITRFDPDG